MEVTAPAAHGLPRSRLEMARLADAGWGPPQIARHLRISARRARFWHQQFLAAGFDALRDEPHVGQTSRLTPVLVEAVREQLDRSDRSWTTRQLAA